MSDLTLDLSHSQLFLRGKPHLQKFMRRLPKTHKKLPMKKDDEPDFYAMDKSHPLPTLEEAPLPTTAMMPAMRQQQALGAASPGMLTPSNIVPPMGTTSGMGMSAYKDFEPRDSLIGMMGQSRACTTGSGMGMSGMNGMSSMGSLNGMGGMSSMGSLNGMGSMGAMSGLGSINHTMAGSMNGMNGMGSMNGMNSMNGLHGFGGMNAINSNMGMSSLREHTGAFGSTSNGMGNELDLQRLRQLQQMRMMEQQMPTGMMAMGNDALSMNMRLSRQPC